jgi:hypothetical protein
MRRFESLPPAGRLRRVDQSSISCTPPLHEALPTSNYLPRSGHTHKDPAAQTLSRQARPDRRARARHRRRLTRTDPRRRRHLPPPVAGNADDHAKTPRLKTNWYRQRCPDNTVSGMSPGSTARRPYHGVKIRMPRRGQLSRAADGLDSTRPLLQPVVPWLSALVAITRSCSAVLFEPNTPSCTNLVGSCAAVFARVGSAPTGVVGALAVLAVRSAPALGIRCSKVAKAAST